MGKIRQLDDILSNKIAAGEVVERPSSVVKELVENSIDAGASKIDIFIEDGGMQKIKVCDNGEGMEAVDARLCFSRHATSKIKDDRDLFNIMTLGFRGEAIPSIASVSRFDLRTSTGFQGTSIVYEFGKYQQEEVCDLPKGTQITVTKLFQNVPARLKYLKSVNSEFAAIHQYVERMALAYPKIAFHLYHNDKAIFQTNGKGQLLEVIANMYGIATAKNMLLYLLRQATQVELNQTTSLTNAITTVLERREAGETVGFNHVIELLCQDEDKKVVEVGEYFKAIIRNSILELAFSDGNVKGLSYDERVTVLEIADLSLPKADAETISDHEVNSICLMFALGAFCKHFGERSLDETLEIFDEAWVLMQSSEGQAVIKSMRRVGRSKYNTLGLVTQSVHDAENDDDSTGFGTIFAFYEKSERKDILKHVGLEVTEKNLEWLDNMVSGECLYYDVYGNLNMIAVDNIHPDIDPLLKPMKQTKSSALENKYAS